MIYALVLYLWMACLYVKKEYRHYGIGTMLQNKVMDYAKQLGYSYIYLITHHNTCIKKWLNICRGGLSWGWDNDENIFIINTKRNCPPENSFIKE